MNVTPTQNNSQSFGMAYRMKGDASKRIAEEILEFSFPKIEQDYFVNKLAKPLRELTTEVIADGEKVFIEHPVTKQRYEVLDHSPWQTKNSNCKEIHYPLSLVKNPKLEGIGEVYAPHAVQYSESQNIGKPAWDAAFVYKGMMRKHIVALEVAKDFDRIAAAKAQDAAAKTSHNTETNKIASKLQELFG